MRMQMIRNIVFDMGNVMIRFDPGIFMDREGITDPGDRKLVLNELFHSVEWSLMDFGILEEATAEPLILPRFPDRLKDHVHNLLWFGLQHRIPFPGMEDLARRLKKAGYGIWLLSNASRSQPGYWSEVPASRLFDGALISCSLGVVKPMHEIYEAFMEKFSLLPEECVFIDDAPINVAGAVACGWHGIVFHGDSAELAEKLSALGVHPADE